ncbi:MAG: hypothetical protein J0L92_20530 [Deltaproteobacteria bacterium]|nr:hypothetical protein [Deltaproteobacteria bacterium]
MRGSIVVRLGFLAALTCVGCESRVSLGQRCATSAECDGLTCRFGRCRAECTTASDCTQPGAFCIGATGAGVCTVPVTDDCSTDCVDDGLVCAGTACSTACTVGGSECLAGSSCQEVGAVRACVASASEDAGSLDATSDAGTPTPSTRRQLCTGEGHACVLRAGLVHCWGLNQVGQLGDGTTATGASAHQTCGSADCATSPGAPVALHVASTPLTDIVEISCGAAHTCAIDAMGRAYCWGGMGDAGLGHDEAGWAAEPVLGLDGFHADAIRGGRFHTCVREDASMTWRCWGQNGTSSGGIDDRLGTGGTTLDRAATAIAAPALDDASEVAGGGFFTCAAMADGTVSCRGSNVAAQVAPRSSGDIVLTGHTIDGLTSPSGLAAGAFHACALVGTEVRCWGSHHAGQLGAEAPSCTPFAYCRNEPAPVRDTRSRGFVSLWSGAGITNTSCAIAGSGEVVCWGSNVHGLAGVEDALVERVPELGPPIAGISGALEVSVSETFACALDASGDVHCWGANDAGQLGCGSSDTAHHASPPCTIPFD